MSSKEINITYWRILLRRRWTANPALDAGSFAELQYALREAVQELEGRAAPTKEAPCQPQR